MPVKSLQILFDHYQNATELDHAESGLIRAAMNAASKAYAPYSHFPVGAALLLENGQIITGSNQENASYPCGVCAERTALYAYASLDIPSRIISMAVCCPAQEASEWPASPCGFCRQVMTEFEQRNSGPITVLMGHPDGQIIRFESCSTLLPFVFSSRNLQTPVR